jgi:hypothetical protein
MPETIIRSIIPAAPGWFVIEHCSGGEVPDCLAEEPVIAWIVTAHCDGDTIPSSEARPVTADYATNEMSWLVLKRPDGRYVVDGGERWFGSAAELLEYFRERKNAQRIAAR